MIRTIFSLAVLMLSNLGYWEFFRRKWKLERHFLPVFTIGVQFLALFAGGLTNLLPHTAAAVLLTGLVLLIRLLRQEKSAAFSAYLCWGYGFLAAGCILVLLAVRGHVVNNYDNYTHWALVVKTMLQTNRFPNFVDSVVGYQSYPLGSSAYLYYVCTIVGRSEDIMLFAQGYMLLATLLPVFSLVKKHHAPCTALIALAANFLLSYNVTLYDLLVDSLLPLTGMAACLFLYRVCRRSDRDCSILCAIPLLCLTVQIKNSAVFFLVIALLLLWMAVRRSGQPLTHILLTAASPLAVMLLWNRHCDYVFPTALDGFHALSTSNFSNTIAAKSMADIQYITRQVLRYVLRRSELKWLLVCVAVLCVIALIAGRSRSSCAKFAAAEAGLYVTYTLGITLMYLFSMSLGEARTLACISRYMRTIDIAMYYLALCWGLDTLCRAASRSRVTALSLLVLAAVIWYGFFGRFTTIFRAPSASRRIQLETLVTDYNIPTEQSYFICIPSDDALYTQFMGIYLMDSGMVEVRVIDDASDLLDAPEQNFFLNLDPENPIIQRWVEENYPQYRTEQAFPLFF